MPIKYNLTKYDKLADRIHCLLQKDNANLTEDEQNHIIGAVLFASFSPSHSWETARAINESSISLMNTLKVRNEYNEAKQSKWKNIRNTDVQYVSERSRNINGMFPMWLYSIGVDRQTREQYRVVWTKLMQAFSEECDYVPPARN